MGIASWLGIGGEISEPVKAVGSALDKLFTSDEEKLTKNEIIERTEQNPLMWQKTLDMFYAQSSNWFIAAARPFNVWVAGLNLAQLGIAVVWFEKNVPEWYADASVTAFLGALGLYGVARTVEKIKGKDK
jgi:hypothetical protein